MIDYEKRLIRLSQVREMTGLSKTSIYARIAEGTFPRQIPIGPRIVAWIDSDIKEWIETQIKKSRG